jgi:hypothetical protein
MCTLVFKFNSIKFAMAENDFKSAERVSKSRVARFFSLQHTKIGKYVPNYHKIYQIDLKYIKWTYK